MKLQDLYRDYNTFLRYNRVFKISSQLGFKNKDKCWRSNPVISIKSKHKNLKFKNLKLVS